MLTWSDILTYLRLFLRWWFVLALAVVLSVATAWVITARQPDVFSSQASLRVGNNFEVAAPNQAQVALSNVLGDYYAALAKREVILAPVVEQLQLGFDWRVIRDRMMVPRVDRGANLLELTVSDTNPERAAAIANAIGQQLIAYTPNAPEKVQAQQAEISRQLEETQANIQAVEAKITELEDNLASLSSAIDISDVQSQLDALQVTRQRYVEEYANLLGLSNQTSTNSLTFFEQARPAVVALPKKRGLTLAMAGAGGLLLAIVAVLILDRLDERWRNGRELQSRTGIRSLGDVPNGVPLRPGLRGTSDGRYKALNNAYSNMVQAAKSKLPRTLLISSPHPSDERSALAIDIAEMYARTGHRVLLVDAESGHSNIAGLLGQEAFVPPAMASNGFDGPGSLWSYVRPTPIHNVLMLSGREAGYERFSSLVPLAFWPEMLAHLRKSADVVIFDGPGALAGPDAGLLAPMVEGVMLVLNGKSDSRSVAMKARKQLMSESDTKFLGAIVTSGGTKSRDQGVAAGAKGNGLQIAVGRQGITIRLGESKPAPALTDGGYGTKKHLLRSPEVEAEAAVISVAHHAPAEQGAAVVDQSKPVTLDDLLEIEHGGATVVSGPRAQPAPSHGARNSGPTAHGSPNVSHITPDLGPIITPPPAEPAGAGNAPGASQQAVVRPERQRRARIANSRRAGRPSGPSARAEGADSV